MLLFFSNPFSYKNSSDVLSYSLFMGSLVTISYHIAYRMYSQLSPFKNFKGLSNCLFLNLENILASRDLNTYNVYELI